MARDCEHGQLARSCEICDLRAEVDRLTAERDRAERVLDAVMSLAYEVNEWWAHMMSGTDEFSIPAKMFLPEDWAWLRSRVGGDTP